MPHKSFPLEKILFEILVAMLCKNLKFAPFLDCCMYFLCNVCIYVVLGIVLQSVCILALCCLFTLEQTAVPVLRSVSYINCNGIVVGYAVKLCSSCQ